jgi:TolB-like protein
MSFFAELKRRNVIRVGILYLVGAWLLLQLTDVLSSLLPVPEWTGSLVVLLLVIGFVPVLVFSWAYGLTPEGLKRDKDIDRSQPIDAAIGQRINLLIVSLLVLAIAAVVVDRVMPGAPASEAVADAAPPPAADLESAAIDSASIAVLPFADLSQQQDQRYFADGIAEELLNVLVRVDGLRVASRTSSFGYRDTRLNAPQIAQELKVQHILEGSVRKDQQRVRITAQLIDAQTDKHLWSQAYDRDLSDIFEIQDEIANAIVDSLIAELGIERGSRAVTIAPATANLDAYELYLKGRDLFQRRTSLPLSIALFEKAIELDPGFARAWEALAASYAVIDDWVASDVDHLPAATAAAKKAIELDPALSMPYAVLASTDLTSSGGSDWVAAFRNYDQASINDPKNTTSLLWRGIDYRHAGFFDQSADDLERCLEIDPLYLNCKLNLALTYLLTGDEVKGRRVCEETLLAGFAGGPAADFVAAYFRSGQRLTATLLATTLFPSGSQAPLHEWITALENPDGDHREGLARFDRWSEESGFAFERWPAILIALKAYDRIDTGSNKFWDSAWTPESSTYRQSEQFRNAIREKGILRYWQAEGFPPQCEPIGDDSFRCD